MKLEDGNFSYEVEGDWAELPGGWTFHEVADVTVDSKDRVYVFSRSENPVMVFDQGGNLIDSWGGDTFERPHGITMDPDDNLYCVDDGDHTVRKCTPDGEIIMTLGKPGDPAPYQKGEPFNRPTKLALAPDGSLYISDGYGNAKVHKFSPDGNHLFSWGEYGTDPGAFNLVHSVNVDKNGKVYVADRENHRIQIFDPEGNFLDQWVNMHRPCGFHLDDDLCYIGELATSMDVNKDYPNLGPYLSIYDLEGERLARLGRGIPGEALDQFWAPHGIAVDSEKNIYIGEVSWSFIGHQLEPPKELRSFRRLVKI